MHYLIREMYVQLQVFLAILEFSIHVSGILVVMGVTRLKLVTELVLRH